MIVATPTWTHREKRSRRDHDRLSARWFRHWQSVPWDAKIGSMGCQIVTGGLGFSATLFVGGRGATTLSLGWFKLLEEAQTACDLAAEKRFGTSLEAAVANWRDWVKAKRAASRAARDSKTARPPSPEAIERSQWMIEELDDVGDRR